VDELREWCPMAFLALTVFVYVAATIAMNVRDRLDQRICRKCEVRKFDNAAHYEDAIWGHEFVPHIGDEEKAGSAGMPVPTETLALEHPPTADRRRS
jgi:hypothetical protein